MKEGILKTLIKLLVTIALPAIAKSASPKVQELIKSILDFVSNAQSPEAAAARITSAENSVRSAVALH